MAPKVKRTHPFVKYGLPLVLLVVGGYVGLTQVSERAQVFSDGARLSVQRCRGSAAGIAVRARRALTSLSPPGAALALSRAVCNQQVRGP